MPYQHDPLILHVVALVIIVGGLGPVVVVGLPEWLRTRRVALQSRLVVWTTALLLVLPAALIALVEWSNTLAAMTPVDKLTNAWFQSVTLRTAGFNSIDLAQVEPSVLTVMMALMFVGGSPGSTAGGAKTTTLAVVVLAIAAAARGRSEAQALGWRIPHRTVYEAAAILGVGLGAVLMMLVMLQLVQAMPYEVALFEVVSALGTAGLSIGGTGELDGVGKVIITVCMFIGRVGPLTLFIFLAGHRADAEPGWVRPEQEIQVG